MTSVAKPRELTVTVIHLALWAQLGVLTRIYLNKFFNDGCKGYWGVCLTSEGLQHNTLGAYFVDLPSNMLGSFVMGLLAAAATLGLDSKKHMVIIPASHPWQKMSELHIGLRTGYCGSLTTFASWQLDLIQPLIGGVGPQGGQWAEWLWGLVIGMELSMASYSVGLHCALLWDRFALLGGKRETAPLDPRRSPAVQAMAREERARERDERSEKQNEGAGARIVDQAAELGAEGNVELGEDSLVDDAERGTEDSNHRRDDVELGAAPHRSRHAQPSADPASHHKQANGSSPPKRKSAGPKEAKRDDQEPYRLSRKTTLTTAALLICTTVAWCVLAGLDHNQSHLGRRTQWFALLLSPFGAVLRWLLSGYNSHLPRPLHWFPVGTFAANMLACMIDFILHGVEVHRMRGYWPMVMLPAVRVGFSGALSTVSTFVAEVHAQFALLPQSANGYVYTFTTLACGSLLGVVFYGWAVWA